MKKQISQKPTSIKMILDQQSIHQFQKYIQRQRRHLKNHSEFHNKQPKSPVKSQSLSQTFYAKSPNKVQVSQKYSQLVTKQGNVIWSGATCLAFRQFVKTFLNSKPLQFKKQNQDARQVLQALNSSKFYSTNLSPQAFYTKSGYGLQTIQMINKEVKQKFPSKTTKQLEQKALDDDFISYAYLFKALEYEHPFERQAGLLWFGQPYPGKQQSQPYMVQAFGAVSNECLSQIKIIEYKNPYNFILGFSAKNVPIIKKNSQNKKNQQQLYTPPHLKQQKYYKQKIKSIKQQKNLEEKKEKNDVIYILSFNEKNVHHNQSVHTIIQKIVQIQGQKKIGQRSSNDYLVQFTMPVIDLDIHHQFNEFEGLQIQNKELQGKFLKMVQNIKLKMDQKGVIIQEQAFIWKDQCAISGNIQILLNQPFWLVLTEEDKHPYFVAKINWLPQKVFKTALN